jgi:hypothetical protein
MDWLIIALTAAGTLIAFVTLLAPGIAYILKSIREFKVQQAQCILDHRWVSEINGRTAELEKFRAWSESQTIETTRRLQSIEEKLDRLIEQR